MKTDKNYYQNQNKQKKIERERDIETNENFIKRTKIN
jgi:hypothetical protein